MSGLPSAPYAAARERAEDRRNPARLDVERAALQRPDADVEGVGDDVLDVLASESRSRNASRSVGRHMPASDEPEHPQRVVLVVGVVEEGDLVLAAEGDGRLAADRHLRAAPLDGQAATSEQERR